MLYLIVALLRQRETVSKDTKGENKIVGYCHIFVSIPYSKGFLRFFITECFNLTEISQSNLQSNSKPDSSTCKIATIPVGTLLK